MRDAVNVIKGLKKIILLKASDKDLQDWSMIELGKLLEQVLDLLQPQETAAQIQEPPTQLELTYPGGMKVGITAFGSPSKFNLRAAINEFKFYIENNSKLKLDIRFVQETNLSPAEIPHIMHLEFTTW